MAVQILSPEIRVSLSHSSPSLVTARCSDVVAAPASVAALLQLLWRWFDGGLLVAAAASHSRRGGAVLSVLAARTVAETLLVTVGAAASSGCHCCLFEMHVFVDEDGA